jgi:stage II sporulation protein D
VTLRVGLFSREDGRPNPAKRLEFMVNTAFKLRADGRAPVADGLGFEAWQMIQIPGSPTVEVRDAARNIRFKADQTFRIEPSGRFGSVLLKNAEFVAGRDFDPGDRELRGTIEIVPGEEGFRIINELPLEDYLYGAVGSAMSPGSPPEAYKAQAVVSRTLALWSKARASSSQHSNSERTEICDAPSCQKYLGINGEMREASEAVYETAGLILTVDGHPAKLPSHENCGGMTEEGVVSPEGDLGHLPSVQDSELTFEPPQSPLALERWTHEFPPRGNFCAGSALSPAVGSRWMRLLDVRDLELRAERIKKIGSIEHLRAAQRSPTGRVLALELRGVLGTLLIEGEKAISEFLSPGSLRSTLFTLQPLREAGKLRRVLIWGAGTGHGLGLCRAGAIGQASLGRDFRAILLHYFPRLKLEKQ